MKRRIEIAEYYERLFEGKSAAIKTPYVPEGYRHTFQSYVCRLDFGGDVIRGRQKRNKIMEWLDAEGIITRQGTHAVHKLDYYQKQFGYRDEDLQAADRCDSLTISLPVFVEITEAEQKKVSEELLKLVKE